MSPRFSRNNGVGRLVAFPMRASQTLTIHIVSSMFFIAIIFIADIFVFNLWRIQFLYFRLYTIMWGVNGFAFPKGSIINQSGHYHGPPNIPVRDQNTIIFGVLDALCIRLGYLRFHCGGVIIVCFRINHM